MLRCDVLEAPLEGWNRDGLYLAEQENFYIQVTYTDYDTMEGEQVEKHWECSNPQYT